MKYIQAGRSFVVTLIVLIFLQGVGWARPAQDVLSFMVQPVQVHALAVFTSATQPILSVPRWYRSQQRLQRLESEFAELQSTASKVAQLEKENAQLRTLLEAKGAIKGVLAAPIVSYAVPTIAAGSAEGVRTDQVVTSSGVVLGRVTAVSEHTAQVTLLNSTQVEPILAQTETGVQGLVQGTGRQVIFTQVQVSEEVPVGSKVTAVGQPGIPHGAFLGTTAGVVSSSSAPVQTVTLDQVVSFYTTALVEVE